MRRIGVHKIGTAVLLAACLAMASVAYAVSDHGNPNVSRLWASGPDGDKMACTVFYVRDLLDNSTQEGFSWVLSAGHCAEGRVIKRNADVWVLAMVNWQVVYTSGAHGLRISDFAIGSAPDDQWIRKAEGNRGFWVAREMPDSGRAYVHGFPDGVERVTAAAILPKEIPLKTEVLRGSARLLVVRKGEIAGGSSGSPVIDGQGRVIGIVWAVVDEPEKLLVATVPEGLSLVIVTPIEIVIAAFMELRAK